VLSRREDLLQTVAAELPVVNGAEHLVLAADVTAAESLHDVVDAVEKKFAKCIDFLVNCAGTIDAAALPSVSPFAVRWTGRIVGIVRDRLFVTANDEDIHNVLYTNLVGAARSDRCPRW
jgi:NAD(P)-dependent dehydrogenase (short-subunit alcohol dehydrogenase family)